MLYININRKRQNELTNFEILELILISNVIIVIENDENCLAKFTRYNIKLQKNK